MRTGERPPREVIDLKESKFYRFFRPVIPPFLRPLALKYQEILSYLFFGVLSMAVNFGVYFLVNLFVPGIVANVPAWIGAVAFAFVTNKAFVFEDDGWDKNTLWPQLRDFTAARIFSLLLEEAIFFVFVERMRLNEDWIKVAGQLVVVLTNYVTSKLFVFRRKKS